MTLREIVLDTETTGLDPNSGHRIVEIGCLELKGRIPTGRTFHSYLNPQRSMPDEAFRVHGLSAEFLKNHQTFDLVMDDFLDFIGSDILVIHNARFDLKFLNFELAKCGRDPLSWDRVVDTLQMAKAKFPGSPASLDALCKRYGIKNTNRTLHGALIDSELLADVYMELCGGRQLGFQLGSDDQAAMAPVDVKTGAMRKIQRPARPYFLDADTQNAHEDFLTKIKNPIWRS